MTRSNPTISAARSLAAVALVVCLLAGTTAADMIIGTATRSWGIATVERGGSTIPFIAGMSLENGDMIKTERNSGAVYDLLDIYDTPMVEEEIFGLAGPGGCADADGDRGKGAVIIRGKNRGSKRRIITEIKKGTTRTKSKPGMTEMAKDHEVVAKRTIAKKKGTEYALSYDLGSDMASLSTLSGSVELDNIEYASLPDSYFTDPFNKSADTLNIDLLLLGTSDSVGLFDLLAAGNSVEVNAGFYSMVASPPTSPMAGKAPLHDMEGGLSPEPATMILMGVGGAALLRRRRR